MEKHIISKLVVFHIHHLFRQIHLIDLLMGFGATSLCQVRWK